MNNAHNASRRIHWNTTAVLLLRLLLLAGVLLLNSTLAHGGDITFNTIVGIALALTLPYSRCLKKNTECSSDIILLFIADIVAVSGLVYATGGIHSELAFLYPTIILSAGIGGERRHPFIAFLGCTLAYIGLLAGLTTGYLPAHDAFNYFGEVEVVKEIALERISVFAIAAGISIYLAERGRRIRLQQHDLEIANRQRGALMAATELAHEIRTPLAAISGTVQMLRRKMDLPAEAEAELLHIAQEQSERVDLLIERFLAGVEYRHDRMQLLLARDDDTPIAEWQPPVM